MAYSTTLDQKRREMLRRQLYGKEVMKSKVQASRVKGQDKTQHHSTFSYTNQPDAESSTINHLPSAIYLKHDLTKILIFSSIAIAAQLSLYFALQNHLIKLPV